MRAFICAILLLLVACSDGNGDGSNYFVGPQEHAVGMTSMTFVDTSRPTSAHGPIPEASTRTLETTIVYPAEGTPGGASTPGAPVAVPRFPLTSNTTSGVPSPFAGGDYDWSDTPPMFVLHGVHDVQLIYNQAVRTYNELLPPKELLTLEESDHVSYLLPNDPAFEWAALSTADFLDGELRGDAAALKPLTEDQAPGIATMHWAPDNASNVPVETLPEPETNRQAFISADTDLADGQIITVSWSGFLPGQVVNIMQESYETQVAPQPVSISCDALLRPSHSLK